MKQFFEEKQARVLLEEANESLNLILSAIITLNDVNIVSLIENNTETKKIDPALIKIQKDISCLLSSTYENVQTACSSVQKLLTLSYGLEKQEHKK